MWLLNVKYFLNIDCKLLFFYMQVCMLNFGTISQVIGREATEKTLVIFIYLFLGVFKIF